MSAPDTVLAREIELPGYRVTVAPGALATAADRARESTGAHRFAIVTDANVAPLYARALLASLGTDTLVSTVPPGEEAKTREQWARITDEMLAAGLGRDAALIALGGGVIGDLGGFVAATYMRGIPVVQIPTTLLAMIDASVGGKTGVDTPAGKNLVGAFHRPSAVIADPLTLLTLPPAHVRAGLAEAIKHGVIADRAYFEWTVTRLAELRETVRASSVLTDTLTELIARSVEIKAAVVRADEREGGLRKTLNFGHTLGHAIELSSGYSMLHGEAVAIGMVLEGRLAERAGIAERGIAQAIREAVTAAGLPAARPGQMSAERVLEATRGDKKARRGVVEYALPRRIGEMAGRDAGWAVKVEDSLVLEVLERDELE